MKGLKNHPFAVEAFFESSIVLTFAAPREQIVHLIPECLELDTFQNEWAFFAIAMVQTKNLRPKGFPKFIANDFYLIGYRVFVRYISNSGKRLRGLYILKSETDNKRMEILGNLFTHYNYTTTDIKVETAFGLRTIRSIKSKINIVIDESTSEVNLPESSPFSDWKEARKFAGPLPFTFTFNKEDETVLIIEGIRQNWMPQPIKIKSYSIDFINSLKLDNAFLANAFETKNIPYHWKKGKIEKWK